MNDTGGRPPNIERIDWRLGEMEKHFAAFEAKFDRLVAAIEARFDRLGGQMSALSYVPDKLYQSEQRAQDRQIADTARLIADVEKRMTERADATDTRFQWLLGLVLGAIVVALAGGLVRLALG